VRREIVIGCSRAAARGRYHTAPGQKYARMTQRDVNIVDKGLAGEQFRRS
jgi:hypothetical protein